MLEICRRGPALQIGRPLMPTIVVERELHCSAAHA
jgi:hypothetical protein